MVDKTLVFNKFLFFLIVLFNFKVLISINLFKIQFKGLHFSFIIVVKKTVRDPRIPFVKNEEGNELGPLL